MTYKELKEKIARLETELTEIKEMAVAMKKRVDGGVFKPKNGQKYWYITHSGILTNDQWDDHWADHGRYEIGNCFPTEQAAEDAMRALKLTQKARESQDGLVPDWEDLTQHKYFLDFHRGDIGISDFLSLNIAPVFGYWEDESACKKFIDENEKDLLWFFAEYRR